MLLSVIWPTLVNMYLFQDSFNMLLFFYIYVCGVCNSGAKVLFVCVQCVKPCSVFFYITSLAQLSVKTLGE